MADKLPDAPYLAEAAKYFRELEKRLASAGTTANRAGATASNITSANLSTLDTLNDMSDDVVYAKVIQETVPDAPDNVVGFAEAYWSKTGTAVAQIQMSWDAVGFSSSTGVDENGLPYTVSSVIDVGFYEVWAREQWIDPNPPDGSPDVVEIDVPWVDSELPETPVDPDPDGSGGPPEPGGTTPPAVIEDNPVDSGADEPDYIRITASDTTSSTLLNMQLGVTYDVVVRAMTTNGTTGVFCESVQVTTPLEIMPMAQLTPPILSSSLALIDVGWDGNTINGPAPKQLASAYAEISDSKTGTYVADGQAILKNKASALIRGKVKGQTYWVRLIGVDRLGQTTPPSEPRSIEVVGIDMPDIGGTIADAIDDAQTTADSAQTSADGKTTNWYQGTAPSGTNHKNGDTWFNTSDANKLSRWNSGTNQWVPVGLGAAALDAAVQTEINKAQTALANAATAQSRADKGVTDAASAAAAAATAKTQADKGVADAALAKSAATTAQTQANKGVSDAALAATAASNAKTQADKGVADAATAKSAADAADAAALAASNLAGTKGKVIYQTTAPTGVDANAQTLWINTTGGLNTPMRWVSGTTWVAITDKAATDAAAAASAAASAASTAKTQADKGVADAALAASAAATAKTQADKGVADAALAKSAADAAAATANTAKTNAATAQSAADAAKGVADTAKANALTAQNRADTAFTNAATAQSAAQDAQGTANTAVTDAGTAQTAANTAKSTADTAVSNAATAKSAADSAAAAALVASGIANSKGKVLVQSSAPGVDDRNAQTLWIDTTGSANTPKRWTTGTTWVAVTDKAATDAASTAASAATAAGTAQSTANTAVSNASIADGKAVAAQGTANTAKTNAATAQSKADTAYANAAIAQSKAVEAFTNASIADGKAVSAMATANGKNKIIFSTSNATGTSGFSAGDIWWKKTGSVITGQWEFTTSWQPRTIDDAVIANLNAAKLTAGTIDADRIAAGSLVIGKVGGLQGTLDAKETPSGAQTKANTAKADAISAAATDATTKANSAKAAAEAAAAITAQSKADTAKSQATAAAALDATTKADTAKGLANDAQATADAALPRVTNVDGLRTFRNVFDFTSMSSGAAGSLVVVTQLPFTGAMVKIQYTGRTLSRGDIAGDITLYCYSSNGGTIYSPQYTTTGSFPLVLTLAKSAENKLVLIFTPKAGGTWPYTSFSVTEMQTMYQYAPGMETGWSAAFATDLSSYDSTVVAPNTRDMDDTNALTQNWRTTGTTTIDGGKITADSITAAQIKAKTITANEIAGKTITASQIVGKTITASEIAAKTITATSGIIDNLAITNTMVAANIDGGKITANSLDASKIKANTISASQMIVADMNNMATINESYVDSAPNHTIVDDWSTRNTPAKATNYFHFRPNTGPVPFRRGDRVRFVLDIRSTDTVPFSSTAALKVYGLTVPPQAPPGGVPDTIVLGPVGFDPEDNTNSVWETRVAVEAEIDIDMDGATSFELYLTGSLAGKDIRVRDVRAYIMNAGNLIVDGSITANKIDAEEIWADSAWIERAQIEVLEAGIVEAGMISAGARDELLIGVNHALNVVVGDLEGVTADQEATANTVDKLATYYTFTDTAGLLISKPDSVYGLALDNDAIQMLQNDQVVSYWKGQKMFVSDMEVEKIQMANHQIETYGTDTVIRAI